MLGCCRKGRLGQSEKSVDEDLEMVMISQDVNG